MALGGGEAASLELAALPPLPFAWLLDRAFDLPLPLDLAIAALP